MMEPQVPRNGNGPSLLTGAGPRRPGGRPDPRTAGGYRGDLECTVPYALFEKDERLTRAFRTEREVWDAAERADLTTTDSRGGKVLDNNFEIKPCEASPDELFAVNGQDIFFPEGPTGPVRDGNAASDPSRSGASEKSVRPAKSPS
jgi:hypothetical protein